MDSSLLLFLLRVPSYVPDLVQNGKVRGRVRNHQSISFLLSIGCPLRLAIIVQDEVAVVLKAKNQFSGVAAADVGEGRPGAFPAADVITEVAVGLYVEGAAVFEFHQGRGTGLVIEFIETK